MCIFSVLIVVAITNKIKWAMFYKKKGAVKLQHLFHLFFSNFKNQQV